MEHSKVIEALKGLPKWQFILLWVWLMALAVSPMGWLIAGVLAWLSKK
ncbi:MAG: hypothetical protein FWD62_15435 [Betaproteobacteria bacterium]|nr:hypothetical protein [Betaproteobacteria bacterium]